MGETIENYYETEDMGIGACYLSFTGELGDTISVDIDQSTETYFEAMELRNDPELNTIPVCIITGKPELRRLIYDKKVIPPEGYLDKPVDEDVLLKNIERILKFKRERNKRYY